MFGVWHHIAMSKQFIVRVGQATEAYFISMVNLEMNRVLLSGGYERSLLVKYSLSQTTNLWFREWQFRFPAH